MGNSPMGTLENVLGTQWTRKLNQPAEEAIFKGGVPGC